MYENREAFPDFRRDHRREERLAAGDRSPAGYEPRVQAGLRRPHRLVVPRPGGSDEGPGGAARQRCALGSSAPADGVPERGEPAIEPACAMGSDLALQALTSELSLPAPPGKLYAPESPHSVSLAGAPPCGAERIRRF